MSVNTFIYFGDLDGCSDEPFVYTITPSTAIAVDDDVAVLTAPAPGKVYIRKGARLHFKANHIVVAKDTVITSVATAVDIEPATSAIAVSDTARTWGLRQIKASVSLLEKRTSKFAVTTSDLENWGFGAIIYSASQSNQSIYILFMQNKCYTFGRALVGPINGPDETATFKLFFQAPFKQAVCFSAEPPTEQAKLNRVLKLSGLPARVV